MNLLSISADPKTVKGEKFGFLTAILYLAPFWASGYQMCPMAEIAGCWRSCLNTAGHGGMPSGKTIHVKGMELPDNVVQRARIARTKFYVEDQDRFFAQLADEISAFERRATKKGLVPTVRLNGTSDIRWERAGILATFPQLQFYDYTKLPNRVFSALPPNYHLTLSYSEADEWYARRCIAAHKKGAGLAVVVNNREAKAEWLARGAVDMDEHDLRFLDPPGSLGVLVAKGRARKEDNGFVVGGKPRWKMQSLPKSSTTLSKRSLAA